MKFVLLASVLFLTGSIQCEAAMPCDQVQVQLNRAAEEMTSSKDKAISCKAAEEFIAIAQNRSNESCSDQDWYPEERYLEALDQGCK